VFLTQAVLFAAISRRRLVDGDEGFYLMTARLVGEGRLPYHDFLLTQTPLVPYVYAAWMKLAGTTWLAARLLSALLTAGLGTAIFVEVRRQTAKTAAALAAVFLFATSTHVFAWMPLVKTYALSALLLFLAYRAAARGRSWLWAGLLLGLAADARLYLVAALPVFLWWAWRSIEPANRASACWRMLAGLTAAVAPNLLLVARNPDTWFFDNIGFHAIRSDAGLIGGLGWKLRTLAALYLGRWDGNGIQIVLLTAVVILLLRKGQPKPEARLALALGLWLGMICLLPTPPFVQYFCVMMPFLVVFAASAGASLGRPVAMMVMALFALSAVPDWQRFLGGGEQVAGVLEPRLARNWTLESVEQVSKEIDARLHPGERVLSLWPGFLFQTRAEAFPGLENNAGMYLAERLNAEQQSRYRIRSAREALGDIAGRRSRIVVLGNYEYALPGGPDFARALAEAGYRVERRIGETTLWSAP
jgi:4-amino-4-deoxy-L-arabinose transferase-like glycosyltransferase